MSYSQRSYSGSPVQESYSHTTVTHSTTTTGAAKTVTLGGQRVSEYQGIPQSDTNKFTFLNRRTPEGRESAGYTSITHTELPSNLIYLDTWQTFNYQSAQGRESWLRTYGQDQEWLERIANGGRVEKKITEWDKPWIGAIVVTTDPTRVILKDCVRDGPADEAKLDDDDKIVEFGGEHITDTSSFNRAFQQHAKVGATVKVSFLENGHGSPKTTELKVLSQGHKGELIAKHRRSGVSMTTEKRRQ